MRTTQAGSVFALTPGSFFGANGRGFTPPAIRLYATKADAQKANKFDGGAGRIEEVPVSLVELDGEMGDF
jgi:hypothetical protein